MATTTSPTSRMQEDSSKTQTPDFNGGKTRQAADKAREVAANVTDKAREIASNVTDKARDAASNVGHKVEDATYNVGSGMQSLAGTVRETLPHTGVLGAASSTLASGLENTGRYIQQEGLQGMASDVTNLIRRNPLPALFIGIGLGFILARATSRS